MLILCPKHNFSQIINVHLNMRKYHNIRVSTLTYMYTIIKWNQVSFSLMILNLNGDMSLGKGSTIINSVLICSMTTFLSFTLSLMAKYLMLICLLGLPLFLFLAIRTTTKLSQKIFKGLEII